MSTPPASSMGQSDMEGGKRKKLELYRDDETKRNIDDEYIAAIYRRLVPIVIIVISVVGIIILRCFITIISYHINIIFIVDITIPNTTTITTTSTIPNTTTITTTSTITNTNTNTITITITIITNNITIATTTRTAPTQLNFAPGTMRVIGDARPGSHDRWERSTLKTRNEIQAEEERQGYALQKKGWLKVQSTRDPQFWKERYFLLDTQAQKLTWSYDINVRGKRNWKIMLGMADIVRLEPMKLEQIPAGMREDWSLLFRDLEGSTSDGDGVYSEDHIVVGGDEKESLRVAIVEAARLKVMDTDPNFRRKVANELNALGDKEVSWDRLDWMQKLRSICAHRVKEIDAEVDEDEMLDEETMEQLVEERQAKLDQRIWYNLVDDLEKNGQVWSEFSPSQRLRIMHLAEVETLVNQLKEISDIECDRQDGTKGDLVKFAKQALMPTTAGEKEMGNKGDDRVYDEFQYSKVFVSRLRGRLKRVQALKKVEEAGSRYVRSWLSLMGTKEKNDNDNEILDIQIPIANADLPAKSKRKKKNKEMNVSVISSLEYVSKKGTNSVKANTTKAKKKRLASSLSTYFDGRPVVFEPYAIWIRGTVDARSIVVLADTEEEARTWELTLKNAAYNNFIRTLEIANNQAVELERLCTIDQKKEIRSRHLEQASLDLQHAIHDKHLQNVLGSKKLTQKLMSRDGTVTQGVAASTSYFNERIFELQVEKKSKSSKLPTFADRTMLLKFHHNAVRQDIVLTVSNLVVEIFPPAGLITLIVLLLTKETLSGYLMILSSLPLLFKPWVKVAIARQRIERSLWLNKQPKFKGRSGLREGEFGRLWLKNFILFITTLGLHRVCSDAAFKEAQWFDENICWADNSVSTLGLILAVDEDPDVESSKSCEVKYIVEGGSAAESGQLLVGDVIVRVDGRTADKTSVQRALTGASAVGGGRNMTRRRNGRVDNDDEEAGTSAMLDVLKSREMLIPPYTSQGEAVFNVYRGECDLSYERYLVAILSVCTVGLLEPWLFIRFMRKVHLPENMHLGGYNVKFKGSVTEYTMQVWFFNAGEEVERRAEASDVAAQGMNLLTFCLWSLLGFARHKSLT
ncbi:hypothetical protein GUITHDRAFT_134381 [Guillardia theta CCMP2712]|uniref:PH domain-containing protein n=1 Tax=Guillardia theta (strain CCMP2712) TaxID=905079 RepID=L1JSB8_GUITC|nr:hypothetical protein GUITHDRAFT_134381 [Guillardia theta CCMP2712]EKX51451.1 hypothetical protein GUITHDRAFT_134381 [Guillardia theta CCMP2712]|eukprot:XP_005838431.1 hypothetical protein GUITHDRAFT_134381 [Guillardia theta CCMP2712]